MNVASEPGSRMPIDLAAVHLDRGSHRDPSAGMCIMELVSLLAGQPFTDYPPCVSPVLRSFALRWNDDLDDATRQGLVAYAPRMVGTATDGHDPRRIWLLLDWQIRTFTSAWLRLAGLTADADRLASAAEIADSAALDAVVADVRRAEKNAVAAWDAAWDAARAALRPTVETLQASACELLDRMIAVGHTGEEKP